MRNIIPAIAITLILPACVSANTLSRDQLDAIAAIHVSHEVKITPKADFIGGIGKLLAPGIGGAIGGAIDAEGRRKDETFTEFLTSSGIKVEDICKSQLISRLKSDSYWGTRYSETEGYLIRIEIPYYSLFRKNTFSDLYKPSVLIRYELQAPSGQIIAHGSGSSGVFNSKLPEYSLEEIRANPNLLRDAYTKAADEAISEILQSLAK